MIIIQQLKQTSYTYEQVLSLIKDSHSENKKKGINYSVFSLSLEDFINKTKGAIIPTPVFLPGESQGQGSLVGFHLWGRTELDTTEGTQQQQTK